MLKSIGELGREGGWGSTHVFPFFISQGRGEEGLMNYR